MSDVNFLVAFGAGFISFASPCVLPIVPGYLSIITGLSAGELEEGGTARMGRIAYFTGLFVLGFGTVFVILGAGAATFAHGLLRNQGTITRVSGVIVLVMALYLIGSQLLKRPGLYQEFRFNPRVERYGPFGIPLAGAAFGFGWTPCIGPVLASILGLAATEGSATRGAGLLAVYSLGLGLPFLLVGLGLGRLGGVMGWFKRHSSGITIASASVLALFGVVLMLDQLSRVTGELMRVMEAVGLDRLVELG